MSVRVGINGLGRIGRGFWRSARARIGAGIQVVAVNDLGDAATLAHLMRYDSIRGRLDAPVDALLGHDGDALVLDGVRVPVLHRAEPGATPWGEYGVDVVLDSTGQFLRAGDLRRHLAAGAGRVVVSMAAPDPDVTLLMGVNQDEYDPRRHRIVSPGCCTGNAVAPVLAVLRRHFGVVTAQLTTIHAYDNSHSALHDSPHRNPRLGRSAAVNLVPSRVKDTTRALARVFPDLDGRLEGLAIRVPAAIGCAADLVVQVSRPTTAADVNATLAAAAASEFKGYLDYTEEPLVSSDLVGSPASCTVDGLLTTVVGDSVKIIGWYDNESGFASRLVDVVSLVGSPP